MRRQAKIGIGRFALLLGVVLAPLSPAAQAQAVYGSIFGTVTDNTGAAVPKAMVTVTDVGKGTSVTATTNDSGEFTAEHLIPDTYNVKVEIQGFKSFQQSEIRVFADSSVKVQASLEVGSTGETVNVNADQVPQLKTDRADVSTTFSAQDIGQLPIPDHNFTNLQLLLPGAVQLGWAHAASENPQGSKQIQIDGQAFGGVNYTLDGTDNQDAILGIIVVNPNYESMSEAKIATQNFDAEFGKAVASVQTVQTKSGTNQFHGTAFDNRESNANLARDPFTVSKAQGYPSGLKNQFGGSLGGPIWKDHIFAFGDYQGVRQKVGSPGIGTVPSLRALQTCTGAAPDVNGGTGCDFSDYLALKDGTGKPLHQIFDNSVVDPLTGKAFLTPFPNNVIPANRVSPQALNLFKLLLANGKTPNNFSTDGGLRNNYQGNGTGIFNSNQWDVRGDATLNQRVHIFGRFSRFTDILSGASLFGSAGGPGLGIAGFGGTSNGANDSAAAGVDVAINSKLVTDVRVGYFRYNITTSKNDPGNTNLPFLGENVGTDALPVPINFGTPDITIADTNVNTATGGPLSPQNSGPQFGSGLNMNHCNCPLKEKEDQFQIVNNWTKTIGNHEVKFGADIRYARNLRVPSDSDRTGLNNFGNGPTSDGTNPSGLGFATFILGDVTAFNRYTAASVNEVNAKEFQARDFAYVQDTWRVTPKLTANLGLRYEYYAPERVNGTGNGALLNLSTGYISVAGEGGVPLNLGVSAPKFPLNPRIGVAYQANEKTVIRGGYGRSFDLGVFGSTFGHVVTQNIPVLANQSVSNLGGPTSYAFNLETPSTETTGFNATSTLSVPTNALYTFTSPTINANGQIPINAPIPGAGTTIANGVNVKARPFTERLPTLDAWNVAVQRSLSATLSVEVSYVGNKGTHTLSDGDGNNTNPNESAISLPASFTQTGQALHYDNTAGANDYYKNVCTPTLCPNGVPTSGTYAGATNNGTLLRRFANGNLPACGTGACNWTQDISYYGDDQDTHYNAIQAKVTKTLTQGFNINLNYAYQRGLSNANNFATWNKQAIIGNDSTVRRSAFTAYGLWHLPFGKGQMLAHDVNGVVNGIIGGWQVSPTIVWQSGLPFGLNYSGCSATIPGDAPCQLNGDASSLAFNLQGIPSAGTGVHQFQPIPDVCTAGTSFSCPGLDEIGTIRRNSFFGPNLFNGDASLEKNIAFAERFTAQFRFDAFNVFNHINYGTPSNTTIDNPGAGQITGGPYPTSTGGSTNPRQLQFTVHLAF